MEAIIASVLGGLVSGLFTFLGVWLTIRHENKKTRREELKQQKEKGKTGIRKGATTNGRPSKFASQ